MHNIIISGIDDINRAAAEFVVEMGENTIFAFYGKMGAGKTTFIKAVCESLGVEDVITSPTFAIVNEYHVTGKPVDGAPHYSTIFHFDFYRIKQEEEVYDIGYEDYIDSGAPCFMEWPELIENLLPYDVVKVTIEEQNDGTRIVQWE